MAAEIGVTVSRQVRVDKDGARALLWMYSDYLNRVKRDLPIARADVNTFLTTFKELDPEYTLVVQPDQT